jgi:hypothetical protein
VDLGYPIGLDEWVRKLREPELRARLDTALAALTGLKALDIGRALLPSLLP